MSDKFTQNQVDKIFDANKKWEWIGYLIMPFFLFAKIIVIASIINLGLFFFEKKIKFKNLLTIAIKAEFVFVFLTLCKIIWFAFQYGYTLEDVQSFYPLSALSLVGYKELQPWFVYPFQTLNLFELAYWIILAWLLGKEIQSTTDKALKIVASSYGSALLIWVVAVMFLTLNMS